MKNLRNLVLAAIGTLAISSMSTIATEQNKMDYPDYIGKEVPTNTDQEKTCLIIGSNNQLLGEVYSSENHPDIRYTIKKGDTLYSIIKRYYDVGDRRLSLDYCKMLAIYNNKHDMNLIRQGEDIILPYTMHIVGPEQPIIRDEMFDAIREELERDLIIDALKDRNPPRYYIYKKPKIYSLIM